MKITGSEIFRALRAAFESDKYHSCSFGQGVYIQIGDKYYRLSAEEITAAHFDDVWDNAALAGERRYDSDV